ncbi:MAG: cell wall anchor protein, partial [Ruminiclostridium sp.]|nr:cell wall anchor protein [Ruminiclostridium sp.]
MKKLLALALSLCLLTALSAPAHADVIWEPYDDDFWEEHKGEMVYHNRGYLANGPDGFVTLYE